MQVTETDDVPASAATPARLEIGGTFAGRLTAGDRDWVAISLGAGQSYVFKAYGTGGATGLADPQLALRDANGTSLAFNDDVVAGNSTSMLRYTPAVSGTYYLDVGGSGSATGHYSVRTATDVFTIDQIASQLTDSFWGMARSALVLNTATSFVTVNLTALTDPGKAVARMALETWSATAGFVFVESDTPGAVLRFDDHYAPFGDALYAFAELSGISVDGRYQGATVTISPNWISAFGSTYGSHGYQTYLHEIGHALGLGHAGFYDGNARYGRDTHYRNDSTQLTIMSYFDVASNPYVQASDFQPITPMAADLAAIRYLYPALPVVFAGDTVWGAGSNIPGRLGNAMQVMFDGAPRPAWMHPTERFGFTIVDGGGWDQLDFSRTMAAQFIDMRGGGISDVYGFQGTVVISLGTVIESAKGGQGSDTIYGNDADNFIMLMAGNDVAFAGAGDDVVYSSTGNDLVYAGEGNDEVWGAAGRDTLFGGDGDDTMGGGIDNDSLDGGQGADRLWGGTGDDMISGGAGADEIAGAAGADTLWGGSGNDTIFGAPGHDLIDGGDGDDVLWGGTGHDTITAGSGNDTITGGRGDDHLTGGAGADAFVFHANNGADRIFDFSAADGDRLHLSAWLWQGLGTLTAQQIKTAFGRADENGDATLVFEAAATVISLVGVTDLDALDQSIVII